MSSRIDPKSDNPFVQKGWTGRSWARLRSWEGLLLVILIGVVLINIAESPNYLRLSNQINLFQLSIEKIIVALAMTLIIINSEIDLSVASIMGLAACILAALHEQGVSVPVGILVALLAGALCGAFNGFWIARVGLPSLAVTLAGLIGYRGVARILLEDRSIGDFPTWFNMLGQKPIIGPLPLAMIIFFVLLIIAIVVLQYSGFGRYIYVIGNNREVARYSGVKVPARQAEPLHHFWLYLGAGWAVVGGAAGCGTRQYG